MTEMEKPGTILPAYHRIRQYIFARVAATSPLEEQAPLTTERELCELFGVSRGTVRKAMQMLTDEDVLIRRPHYGTFINPRLIRESIHQPIIGIIIGKGNWLLWDSQTQEVMAGILNMTGQSGYGIRFITVNRDPEQELEAELRNKPAGIIWLWTPEHYAGLTAAITQKGIPLSNAIPLTEHATGMKIQLDWEHYGYELTRRLLALGYPDILFLDNLPSAFAEQKKRGIQRAFTEAGSCPPPDNCLNAKVDVLWEEGDRLLASGRFRAVNCSNAMKGFADRHPEVEFIIPGVDSRRNDASLALPAPTIPWFEIGHTAARLLLSGIADSKQDAAETLQMNVQFPNQ